jgi:hypothetical protein
MPLQVETPNRKARRLPLRFRFTAAAGRLDHLVQMREFLPGAEQLRAATIRG